MAKPGKSGIIRIIHATKYSIQGLKAAFKHEAAFRQELFLSIILGVIALFVAQNIYQLLWLLFCSFFVVTAEILNSAIEAVVDRIGDEYHELAGRAKDLGSSAVFIALTFTVLVWAIIILENCGIHFLPLVK